MIHTLSPIPLMIPQIGNHPDVVAAPVILCIGGPCNGQTMQNPEGRVLIVFNTMNGPSAMSLPHGQIHIAKLFASASYGYIGHYERHGEVLQWVG
jgi:hypothetical protein